MSRALTLGTRTITDDEPCYVIAEIGHNHQGSVATAKELFRQAKDCGASAVKLQKRCNRRLYSRSLYDKPYDHPNSFGATYGAHREALEFGVPEYAALDAYAHSLGIDFFATVFDPWSADDLHPLGLPAVKLASADLVNLSLIQHVAAMRVPLILSTGGATMAQIDQAMETIAPYHEHVALLQCTASYPAPWEDLNLRTIETLRDRYPETVVGYSGHDSGIAAPLTAYVLGARIVEKHFTLNRTMKGTDHAMSLEPVGMRKLCRDLSRMRVALGDGQKRPMPSEGAALHKMQKSVVLVRDLPAGAVLTAADVALRSPYRGTRPANEFHALIGAVLAEGGVADEPVPAVEVPAHV